MAVESAGRCSLHLADSFSLVDSGFVLGTALLALGASGALRASGVAGLFSVGRCTGARSLAVDPVDAVGGASVPAAAGAVGGAKVGGGPVSGLRLGVVGRVPMTLAGGIAGIGIAW